MERGKKTKILFIKWYLFQSNKISFNWSLFLDTFA